MAMRPSMIVGPSCDSGDRFGSRLPTPELEVGDVLIVPSIGAYSAVTATRFNGLPTRRSIWFD